MIPRAILRRLLVTLAILAALATLTACKDVAPRSVGRASSHGIQILPGALSESERVAYDALTAALADVRRELLAGRSCAVSCAAASLAAEDFRGRQGHLFVVALNELARLCRREAPIADATRALERHESAGAMSSSDKREACALAKAALDRIAARYRKDRVVTGIAERWSEVCGAKD